MSIYPENWSDVKSDGAAWSRNKFALFRRIQGFRRGRRRLDVAASLVDGFLRYAAQRELPLRVVSMDVKTAVDHMCIEILVITHGEPRSSLQNDLDVDQGGYMSPTCFALGRVETPPVEMQKGGHAEEDPTRVPYGTTW